MNAPRTFSIDPVARLVRSTCLSLRVIAIWMFLICLPGFCVVGNSISDPGNMSPAILVFVYGFVLPFGNAIALLICANQIERGKRTAVIVAIWVAFAWLMLVLVLMFLLLVDAIGTLTGPPNPGDEELDVTCSVAMVVMLMPICIYGGVLVQKLRTILRKTSEGFLVLPNKVKNQSNLAETVKDWPNIE